tara:strand:- start:303 stop:656 length:354 start_codon:yes stop_codon:yes gene_type:complete
MEFSLKPIYETKTREELIELLLLKNVQSLKQEDEIEKSNNLNQFIQSKLNEALKGNITIDPIVNSIIKKHLDRHKEGMTNFGKTMNANTKPFKEWVSDAQQESMDQILYLEKTLNKE